MSTSPFLRSLSLLALAALALAAHAADAYSNIVGGVYATTGPGVTSTQSIAYQFTPTLGGTLAGFMVAVNNSSATASGSPFALGLYSDASGKLGSLLGSFAGTTTGKSQDVASPTLASVAASGVTLATSSTYWLVASTTGTAALTWNYTAANGTAKQNGAYNAGGSTPYTYASLGSGAFSVQVANPVPEPAPFAALGLGAIAVLRRRRKA